MRKVTYMKKYLLLVEELAYENCFLLGKATAVEWEMARIYAWNKDSLYSKFTIKVVQNMKLESLDLSNGTEKYKRNV